MMRNRAMKRKLDARRAVDVAPFRTDQPASGLMGYVIPAEAFVDGADYCDSETEAWIWSIGRHRETGELHASTANVHYQHPRYECVWLR